MTSVEFAKAMLAAGWEKVADMGTHTHRFANDHGVECNIGLDAHNRKGPKLELELVDGEQDLSVLLSAEPGSDALQAALAHITAGLPAVTADGIMDFAKGLAQVCPVYAEPSQVTVDAGYPYEEGDEDWIKL